MVAAGPRVVGSVLVVVATEVLVMLEMDVEDWTVEVEGGAVGGMQGKQFSGVTSASEPF